MVMESAAVFSLLLPRAIHTPRNGSRIPREAEVINVKPQSKPYAVAFLTVGDSLSLSVAQRMVVARRAAREASHMAS